MIRIQKASEIESAFFGGRDFGSSIDVVRDVLNDVRANGDAAVQKYSKQFDVASPSALEIPQAELKAAAEKMQKENPDLYHALCYSRDLAVRFAKNSVNPLTILKLNLNLDFLQDRKILPLTVQVFMFLQEDFRSFLQW